MNEVMVIDIPEGGRVLSLELPELTSFDDWVVIGRRLCVGSQAINWHIGDWWAFGDHRYGARAKAAAEGIFGRELQTIMNSASVCRSFETSRRRDVLSWSHHVEVAALPPQEADSLLDLAEREEWSVRDLRSHISGQRKETRVASTLHQFPTRETVPSIAREIETEAARRGEHLTDFIATLIEIGWRQYLAELGGV